MSFFSKILKFIFGENRVIENDFFGKMLDAGGYFECRRYFLPTGEIIECAVDTDSEESFENQIKFFKRIENDFDKIISIIRPHLEKEVHEWEPDYIFNNFLTDFKPNYIEIRAEEFETSRWRISFSNRPLAHCSHVEMEGFEIKYILMDG